ncbi:MAG: aldehyde dehydrogenase family protein [Burkholderiaceae bacterium]|nr:aldehyde dehydrogenase family protein [Burkholderiaceae bacterium]
MTHAERATYLRAIADELDSRLDDGALIWTTESGVLPGIGKKSLAVTHKAYRYYAGLAETFPFQERHTPKGGGNMGLLVREAVGVVAGITGAAGTAGSDLAARARRAHPRHDDAGVRRQHHHADGRRQRHHEELAQRQRAGHEPVSRAVRSAAEQSFLPRLVRARTQPSSLMFRTISRLPVRLEAVTRG